MTPENDPILFRLMTEIGIVEQLAGNALQRRLPDGLTTSQFSVLHHLARLGGEWSPARLAAAFQVTKGAMTNTLQRLEQRGLVSVVPDPADGRAKCVAITAAGEAMRARCVESVEPMLGELTAVLSEKEMAQALPVLEKLRRYLDEHRS